MHTGQRPGESVLAERFTILPWFGPMLEASFGALFEREILPALPAFAELDATGGVAVDLGCGNGWYLRKLAARFPNVRGIGLDGFEENVRQADAAAKAAGVGERLTFRAGDIHHYTVAEKVSLIAMNRALHHVWDRKESVFAFLRDSLAPGGTVVIWEPRWPDEVASLRDPRRRPMAFQNLSEHVQGNHFLRPAEIEAAMRAVGLSAETFLFAEGNEAVVVGRKGA
jgi:trans-aconitate methyltransferase